MHIKKYMVGMILLLSIGLFMGIVFPAITSIEHAIQSIDMILAIVGTSGATGMYLATEFAMKKQDEQFVSVQKTEAIVVDMATREKEAI